MGKGATSVGVGQVQANKMQKEQSERTTETAAAAAAADGESTRIRCETMFGTAGIPGNQSRQEYVPRRNSAWAGLAKMGWC